MLLDPSNKIQFALTLIIFNAIVLSMIYVCDPNQDIRRRMHDQNPHAYRIFNTCYAILAITFALNIRFIISHSMKTTVERLGAFKSV